MGENWYGTFGSTAQSTFHLLPLKLTKQQRDGKNMQTIFSGIKSLLTRYKKAAKIFSFGGFFVYLCLYFIGATSYSVGEVAEG